MKFKDYFSEHSKEYSEFRPNYPDDLFSYLASISKQKELAWDCATGTGQVSIGLSHHFSNVIATDASSSQISHAMKRKNIMYEVCTAEKSNINSHSIDLITVAQALHWFDIDAFGVEVNRVLKNGGVLAVWSYNLMSVENDIDEIVSHLYGSILGDYWPKERKLVEDGYKNINFPFSRLNAAEFNMSTYWNFFQLIGYLNTWSSVKNYENKLGVNPVDKVKNEILKMWGNPNGNRLVEWPLNIQLWQKFT